MKKSVFLYSENENATTEQKSKAKIMIEILGFYRGEHNVVLQEINILDEKNKANLNGKFLSIKDCER